MPESSPPRWRRAAAATVQRLPAPVRRSFWRRRRALARARRRTLERRGDFSRSRPGLYQMDVALDQLLGITGGFFVEAGAFDGYEQSNTYFLERARGWEGSS